MFSEGQNKNFFYLALGLVLFVAIFLRFFHLSSVPGWYTDEGFYIQASWNFIHGDLQTFGIQDWTFLSPFSTTPPLYHTVLGGLLLLFGKQIIVARTLIAVIGVITTLALVYVGKTFFKSKWVGLLIGAMYAVLPNIVANNRWSFPQALVGLFVLLAFFFLWQYRETQKKKMLWLGLGMSALLFSTTFYVWQFGIVILFLLWRKHTFASLGYAALAYAPILLILLVRFLSIPEIFLQDLSAIFSGSFVGSETQYRPSTLILYSLSTFFRTNLIFFVSLVGMFMIPVRKKRTALILGTLVLMLPILYLRTDYLNHFYPALVFTPLLLLGLGGLVNRFRVLVAPSNVKTWQLFVFVFGTVFSLIFVLYAALDTARITENTLARSASKLNFIARNDHEEQKKVIEFVNARVDASDLIISPNNIGWALKGFSVDPVWVACYTFRDEIKGLSDERFVRPLAVEDASYFIVDRFFMGDSSVCRNNERFQTIYSEFFEADWPLLFGGERYFIYQNPNVQDVK